MIKFTEKEKKEAYKRVSKQIKKIKPKNLNNQLWSSGWAHTMGWSKHDNTELWDMISQEFEEFQDLYYEWHSICSHENATGKNEDFNEHLKEYYPNIDEDEKWNIAHDWVDDDGWTYSAYISYITELVENAIEEIKEEQFDKEYEVYKKKLETIEGLEVAPSYLYDNYGYKTLNGLEVWTYDDDEYGASNIEKYIEWTSEDGWDYDGFDTFKELFNYIKSNMKKGVLVA